MLRKAKPAVRLERIIGPMSYLKFDKTQMTNLQDSLFKELLLTNKGGAYTLTTLVGCNIRKYHGLLVTPIPEIDDENHVLLSSLDETVVQHGAEFNLGLHKYQGENYSPRGHKYIMGFSWDRMPTTLYRVGGVVLKKEMMFQKGEPRLLIRYTLVDAHSETTLRLKPFLAFRSVRQFTHRNWTADTGHETVAGGIGMRLYSGYPELYMQVAAGPEGDVHFVDDGNWYMGLDYPKERERGYDSNEDLYVPGYLELNIKKDESIVFTAGLTEIDPDSLPKLFEQEADALEEKTGFYQCLVRAGRQFHIERGGENYLIAGWPWFKCRARDMFIAMPGLTLSIGETERFQLYMKTAQKAIYAFMHEEESPVDVYEIEHPDVLLWAVWALQQYAAYTSPDHCIKKYGKLLADIMKFLREGHHPNFFVHENGLVFSHGKDTPITWMNSTANGRPIVPRTGYIVEQNALWYNALRFYAELLKLSGKKEKEAEADRVDQMAEQVAVSFRKTFINQYGYLMDYVSPGDNPDWSVRPNQIFAVALEYSPLDKSQMKQVVDICTRELVTPKGLRSLSPKSSGYDPIYAGPQKQRDLAYHQGTAWPWLMGFYLEAYLKIYKMSGVSFAERKLIGFEEELFYHCIGTLPELFDGNPPFHGRGAVSYAVNVSSILRAIRLVEKYNERQ